MIAVDPSALVAILFEEEDAGRFVSALKAEPGALLAAASYVELCAVVKNRRGAAALRVVDALLAEAGIQIEPVTLEQAEIARTACARYGVLNFGDVFSYALARDRGVPLLFKGNDFSQTDIEVAG